MKSLFQSLIWRLKGLCPKCGEKTSIRAIVACKAETWVMFKKIETVCTACGWTKEQ